MIFNEKLAFQTAELLLQVNAIKLNIEKPFTWSSGIKSPIYCDNRLILSYPKIRKFISNEISKYIKSKIQGDFYVAGVATGSIAIGMLIAEILKKPFIYVRPEPKAHGAGKQIEGKILEKFPVVVIEDLISTGRSSLNAVEALKKNGIYVLGVFSIFSYGLEIAKINFEKANQKYYSLSDFSKLIECSKKFTEISQDDIDKVNSWKKNPYDWIV
ncbi:MAG: orotate phosphoribosyltransferase [Flavobacteriaceae bacterium]